MIQFGNDKFEVEKAASFRFLMTKMLMVFIGFYYTEWKLNKKK